MAEWFNVVVLKTIVLAPEVRILSRPIILIKKFKSSSSLMVERVAVNHPDGGSNPPEDVFI